MMLLVDGHRFWTSTKRLSIIVAGIAVAAAIKMLEF
jgi:hypothetical protein